MEIIIQLAILIYAIIFHEVAHGYAAYYFGDRTAKYMGRLTLNPIPHIDLVGSILLPAVFLASGAGIILGWAKPVPINDNNFNNPKKDMLLVALAGPCANILLALLASAILKIGGLLGIQYYEIINMILIFVIQLNLVLALFNLIPIPPLDGSHILEYFLSYKAKYYYEQFAPYGIIVIFALAYFGILGQILSVFLIPLMRFLI
ncbi:MAG: site-2 protease family protein [Candidatus Margulisiibacteriota bacterium]|jgi:Zn-dependent protease